MKVRELRARPRSFFETEFRMDGADSKRVLHTRLADEDDEATAAGRVTTSCLQIFGSSETTISVSFGRIRECKRQSTAVALTCIRGNDSSA